MSSGILKEDKLAFQGQTPWHGHGVQVGAKQSIDVWTAATGLQWQILHAPLSYQVAGGRVLQYPERFAFYRSDTGTPLTIASSRFHPVQPREIVEFFRRIVERLGYDMETLGTLKNGKYIWGLAKMGKLGFVDKGEHDAVRAFLLLCTICQPGFATVGKFTGIRVVCNNTLQVALADDSGKSVRQPHTENFDVERMIEGLGLGLTSFERFMKHARELAAVKLLNDHALEFFAHAVGNPKLEPDDQRQPDTVMRLQRRYIDSLNQRVAVIYDKAGNVVANEAPLYPDTLWSAVNLVTNHVDFFRPDRGIGGRLTSAWFGSGAKIKEAAWNTAVRYARTGSFEATPYDTTTDVKLV